MLLHILLTAILAGKVPGHASYKCVAERIQGNNEGESLEAVVSDPFVKAKNDDTEVDCYELSSGYGVYARLASLTTLLLALK
jgi:hypothetical protein